MAPTRPTPSGAKDGGLMMLAARAFFVALLFGGVYHNASFFTARRDSSVASAAIAASAAAGASATTVPVTTPPALSQALTPGSAAANGGLRAPQSPPSASTYARASDPSLEAAAPLPVSARAGTAANAAAAAHVAHWPAVDAKAQAAAAMKAATALPKSVTRSHAGQKAASDVARIPNKVTQSSNAAVVPSGPKKIVKRHQEFLPEYQPCCDIRPESKQPGTAAGDALAASEDAWLRAHALKYPFPVFSGVHKCFNNAEAYTASWLAHKDMVLSVRFEGVNYAGAYDQASVYGYPMKWGKSTNMEAVTHTLLGPLMKRSSVGAFKTLDTFDFSIEHLSLYERRLGLMALEGELKSRTVKAIVDNLGARELAVRQVALAANPFHVEPAPSADRPLKPVPPHLRPGARQSAMTSQAKLRVDETMVLMPFYGVAVGTGHSVVSTRFAYLNLTFWSHYRVFPHIGVVVGTQEDYDFVTGPKCGLPWAEVVSVIGHISMPKNMGVAAGIAAQQRFRNGAWAKFKYMYWTESDQVLMIRDAAVEPLYGLVADGVHLVAPHRLLPFPRSEDFDPSLAHLLKTLGGNEKELADNDATPYHAVSAPKTGPLAGSGPPLESASCCFDPGDCTRRDHWSHFSDKSKVCMMRFGDNMGVVNGEANIFLHTWRTCQFSPTRVECPRAY